VRVARLLLRSTQNAAIASRAQGVNMNRAVSAAGSLAALALLAAFSAPIFAAPPAAPTNVTFDAAPKKMIFDWDVVPVADFYELWFRPNSGGAIVKFGERPASNPHWVHNIAAHLLNWFDARWEIRACNSDGCSSTGLIDVGSTVVNLVGHVKPGHPQPFAAFGSALDVSEDGRTLVAIASDEQRTIEEESATATIYVFRRINGRWRQEARFLPSSPQTGNGDGVTVSLSGNGNVLAVGVPTESYGESPDQQERGAVYVFRRDGSRWRQEVRLDTNGLFGNRHFGHFTKLSEDASTLVAATLEGMGGPSDVIFYQHSVAGWQITSSVNRGAASQLDYALSGDGKFLFSRVRVGETAFIDSISTLTGLTRDNFPVTLPTPESCYKFSAFEVDYTGDRILSGVMPKHVSEARYDPSRWKPAVSIFRRVSGQYSLFAELKPSIFQPTDYARRSLFGRYAAMSRDGEFVAVNDPQDARGANLVQLPPDAPFTGPPRGAIYMFGQGLQGYSLRRHIGAPSASVLSTDRAIFGAMAFGRDGRTFIAGQPRERSGIGGIHRAGDAAANDRSMEGAGAVWLY
jgi:hypothetical protein